MINLDNHFIAMGVNRTVYLHPLDCNKCIKIPKKHIKVNEDEYRILDRLPPNINYYTKNYGFIDTNLGRGLVFDLIKNNTNVQCDVSLPLGKFVKKHGITDELISKINELVTYLINDKIMISDFHAGNILVQTDEYKIQKLFICDGITSKTLIDTRNYMFNKKLKKWFIKRKFRKLMRELKDI
jgi:hypothetical protein